MRHSLKTLCLLTSIVLTAQAMADADDYALPIGDGETAVSSSTSDGVTGLTERVYVYVDLLFGYQSRKWPTTGRSPFGFIFDDSYKITKEKNKNGSFLLGFDTGYEFNDYLALEFGGFFVPEYTVDTEDKSNQNNSGYARVNSLIVFLGPQFQYRFHKKLQAFFMPALTFSYNTMKWEKNNSGQQSTLSRYWTYDLTAGVKIFWTKDFYTPIQYTRIGAKTSTSNENPYTIPAANMFLTGLSFRFGG